MLLSGVILSTPEPLYSNCFPITRVPEVIHSFVSKKAIDRDLRRALAARWAFRDTTPNRLVSFHQPPEDVVESLGLTNNGGSSWPHVPDIEGMNSRNLVMELLRKALVVKCAERGLVRSEESSPLAFPAGLLPNDCLKYTKPDNEKTRVQVVGERSVRRSGASVSYRYHLAPTFFVRDDVGETIHRPSQSPGPPHRPSREVATEADRVIPPENLVQELVQLRMVLTDSCDCFFSRRRKGAHVDWHFVRRADSRWCHAPRVGIAGKHR